MEASPPRDRRNTRPRTPGSIRKPRRHGRKRRRHEPSADPIFNTRIKIVSGDGARWGPQLLGNLPPGHSIEVIARIRSESPEFNGFARFADVEGRGWVSNSMSAAEADNDVNRWIEEGREFAARELLPHERGTMDRSDQRDMPDFDAWAVHIVDDLEE